MKWAQLLISWYEEHKRDLPWRHSSDPYNIWLSEVILQQTRVDQGLPYYYNFLKLFPDVFSLAAAKEETVLKAWQGLGYYSRARNLHHTAQQIVNEHNGSFPANYSGLLQLKGIGPYTAAAIAAFAYGERVTVTDGNVFRFLSRYLGIKQPIDSAPARKSFSEAGFELMDDSSPKFFNQALMEFGSLVCTPRQACCSECPFRNACYACNNNMVYDLPVKKKRNKTKERYFNYFHVQSKDSIYLMKRSGRDIWKNLFEFPLYESERKLDWPELLKTQDIISPERSATLALEAHKSYTHQLTHQKIHASFWRLNFRGNAGFIKNDIFEVALNELNSYPVSRLTDKYLEELNQI